MIVAANKDEITADVAARLAAGEFPQWVPAGRPGVSSCWAAGTWSRHAHLGLSASKTTAVASSVGAEPGVGQRFGGRDMPSTLLTALARGRSH